MSLDVYLEIEGATRGGSGIFVREDGATKEISRAEWDEKFPGREPVVAHLSPCGSVFSRNITHNLGRMALEAGIYSHLWRPEEIGISHARQLIDPLAHGLDVLESDPDRFRGFNPKNGWGSYDGLCEFVRAYLAACREYPDAAVTVSR